MLSLGHPMIDLFLTPIVGQFLEQEETRVPGGNLRPSVGNCHNSHTYLYNMGKFKQSLVRLKPMPSKFALVRIQGVTPGPPRPHSGLVCT